ncbi:MAG: hypothetical protein ABSG61_10915 [Gemmatimonadales bacterium]|jgi:hypothetical protein
MSLTTIAVAFILVAAVFNATGLLTARWANRDPGPGLLSRVWPGATFEALILTLVAALWFGSLGHGGWVILFLLLGALPAGDRWLRRALAGAPARGEATAFVAALLKYLLAGLGCVWLLT